MGKQMNLPSAVGDFIRMRRRSSTSIGPDLKKLKSVCRRSTSTIGCGSSSINEHSTLGFRGQHSRSRPILEDAKKSLDEGIKFMKKRDYESSERCFRDALGKRLFTLGADHELVLQCHSKLMDLACLRHDFEKCEHHLKAIQRIRGAWERDAKESSDE